jgi:hypothetical protein
MSGADKFRKFMANRDKQHTEFMKGIEGKSHAEKMQAMMSKIKSNLNKEEVALTEDYDSKLNDIANKHGFKKKESMIGVHLEHPKHGRISLTHAGAWTHDKPKGDGQYKGSGMATHKTIHSGRGLNDLDKHLSSLSEEVEQIDELKKTTVKSWLGQQKPILDKKPGEERKAYNTRTKKRSVSWNRALDRLTGHKPMSEEVIDEVSNKKLLGYMMVAGSKKDPKKDTKDRSSNVMKATGKYLNKQEVNKKEMSKSARMIKALYKKHNMKEDMTDWEKEDKSVQTYGKKPKVQTTSKESSYGEDKPKAAVIMTGGTTMTGKPRDMGEIDPMLKNRPGPDDFDRNYGKKQPQ